MSVIPDFIWQPIEIVYGVYALRGVYQGDDRWWIQRLVESESGWMVHNDIYLDAPEPRYITVDVEMSEGWEWCYLNLRDDQGRLVAAEVQPGKVVVEQDFQLREFPFDEESELDFLSPFMSSLTLRRLRLARGQAVTRRVLVFDAEFSPQLVEQSYTRGEDSTFEEAGVTIVAQQVHIRNHHSGTDTTLLVREDGLVLCYPDVADLSLDEAASAGRGRMPPLG